MENVNLEVLMDVSYGLYIVSSKDGEKINGLIVNTVTQTSAEPPTIAVCINKKHLTHELIKKSGVFSISILSQDASMKFIGNFGFKSGRDIDKFDGIEYKLGKTAAPLVLENTVSCIEAEVFEEASVETHTIFIAKVVNTEKVSQDKPMTYQYYHEVKKGKSPEGAPTHIKETKKKLKNSGNEESKYRCEVCGYIYDPQEGDSEAGIEAGTSFEELPADWVCPLCGVGKDQFEKVD